MNPIRLQEAFRPLASRSEELADRFYESLFGANPELQALFAGIDLEAQGRRLVQSLALIAKSADRPEALAAALEPMARRHVVYGVAPRHYALFRRTLLAAMARVADEAWSPEGEEAWADALRWVTDRMVEIHREADRRSVRAS